MYFDGTFFCVIVIPSVSNSDAIIFFQFSARTSREDKNIVSGSSTLAETSRPVPRHERDGEFFFMRRHDAPSNLAHDLDVPIEKVKRKIKRK